MTVTIATDFASSVYTAFCQLQKAGALATFSFVSTQAAGSFVCESYATSYLDLRDPTAYNFMAIGAQ
jgi:hypothetical protein